MLAIIVQREQRAPGVRTYLSGSVRSSARRLLRNDQTAHMSQPTIARVNLDNTRPFRDHSFSLALRHA